MGTSNAAHRRASPHQRVCALVAGVAAFWIAGSAWAQVDVNRANDYVASQGTSALAVVESYHLGPCQQRYRERDWPRAKNECDFILRIFPNHPTALLLVAQVCEQWKSGACLVDDIFERAVAINPKAAQTFVVQGIYFNRVRNYPTAIDRFKKALALDADNMNAHYNLALTYVDTKQFDLANTHAQRAYALGATPDGLRNRLKQAGRWNPDATVAGSTASGTPATAGTPGTVR